MFYIDELDFYYQSAKKYKGLIAEATTIEMRRFCLEQYKMYEEKYQELKSVSK